MMSDVVYMAHMDDLPECVLNMILLGATDRTTDLRTICKDWMRALPSTESVLGTHQHDLAKLVKMAAKMAPKSRSAEIVLLEICKNPPLPIRNTLVDVISCVDQEIALRGVQMLLSGCVSCDDCRDAMLYASANGHEAIVRLFLTLPEHAPEVNSQNGLALLMAAQKGHEAVVRLLLTLPDHAPRADCNDCEALMDATMNGHEAVVRLLLAWPEHAPRADCTDG